MHQFEIGNTYSTRLITSHDTIVSMTVLSRTAKTIKATVDGEPKTLRVREYDGAEYVMPWGRYSMSPMIRATEN